LVGAGGTGGIEFSEPLLKPLQSAPKGLGVHVWFCLAEETLHCVQGLLFSLQLKTRFRVRLHLINLWKGNACNLISVFARQTAPLLLFCLLQALSVPSCLLNGILGPLPFLHGVAERIQRAVRQPVFRDLSVFDPFFCLFDLLLGIFLFGKLLLSLLSQSRKPLSFIPLHRIHLGGKLAKFFFRFPGLFLRFFQLDGLSKGISTRRSLFCLFQFLLQPAQ